MNIEQMVSAETRAGLLTLAGVVASLIGLQLVDSALGLAPAWRTVAVFVLFTGFGFGLPQLYLAHVDETVPASYRRGYVLLIVLFYGAGVAGPLSPPASVVIWIIVGLAVGAHLVSEAYAGYQRSVSEQSA